MTIEEAIVRAMMGVTPRAARRQIRQNLHGRGNIPLGVGGHLRHLYESETPASDKLWIGRCSHVLYRPAQC